MTDRSCFVYPGDVNASINLAPLPENTIHLFSLSEINTQMSVLKNTVAAKSSKSVPHLQFLLILDFTHNQIYFYNSWHFGKLIYNTSIVCVLQLSTILSTISTVINSSDQHFLSNSKVTK